MNPHAVQTSVQVLYRVVHAVMSQPPKKRMSRGRRTTGVWGRRLKGRQGPVERRG